MRSKIEQQLSLWLEDAECAGGSYTVDGDTCLDLAWVTTKSEERIAGTLVFEKASGITFDGARAKRIHVFPEVATLLEAEWSEPGTCRLVIELDEYQPRRSSILVYLVHCEAISFVRAGMIVGRADTRA